MRYRLLVRPSAPDPPATGRRERTSQAILAAGAELFGARGVARTTVEDIAGSAGVSVGSVYVHFGSKEGLYLALVEQAVVLSEDYLTGLPDLGHPVANLSQLADAYARFAVEEPLAFRIAAMQLIDPAVAEGLEPVRARISARIEQSLERLESNLAAAVTAGGMRGFDPRRAAVFLWGAWTGVLALSQRDDSLRIEPADLRADLMSAARILVRGVSRDARSAGSPEPQLGEPAS